MSNQAIAIAQDTDVLQLAEWTPDSLRAQIAREKQLRSVVIEYFQSAMQAGHHFYTIGDNGTKPALSKEGALNICSLFKVTPSPDEVAETFHEDGHYTVRARCHIIGRNGSIVATGDGLCTSRESKYAHRWCWGSEVPPDINKDSLKKKEWEAKGRAYVKYQVPNEDLPDVFNTVLKMATKRALVDATLKLPLVSELFTQDLEETIAAAVQTKSQQTKTRASVKDDGHREPPPSNGKSDAVKKAVNLAKQLEGKGIDESDLCMQFLPEGVASFADLTEEQATEIIPALVETLNATLNNK